jgi:predicted nucleic acid-binding protein
MTVLIDTNVVLDYILKREPNAEDARACLEHLLSRKDKAWLTASTITDIYYLTRKALKDSSQAKSVIAKLLNAFLIANVDKTDCINALKIDVDDYEDALVSVCAKKIKAEYVVTQNVKHFKQSSVPAIKPGDLLGKLQHI